MLWHQSNLDEIARRGERGKVDREFPRFLPQVQLQGLAYRTRGAKCWDLLKLDDSSEGVFLLFVCLKTSVTEKILSTLCEVENY